MKTNLKHLPVIHIKALLGPDNSPVVPQPVALGPLSHNGKNKVNLPPEVGEDLQCDKLILCDFLVISLPGRQNRVQTGHGRHA